MMVMPMVMTVVVVMIMTMIVIIVVMVMVMRMPQPSVDHPRADQHDRQTRYRAKNADYILRHHALEQEHRTQPQRENRNRVSERHDRAEKHGMPNRAPRAYQVSRDNSLAMARRQRMSGAKPECNGNCRQHHAGCNLLLMK